MADQEDRYVPIREAVVRVLQEEDMPAGACDRLEVTCLASGEVTWRVWTPSSDQPIGGYFEPPGPDEPQL